MTDYRGPPSILIYLRTGLTLLPMHPSAALPSSLYSLRFSLNSPDFTRADITMLSFDCQLYPASLFLLQSSLLL